MAHGKLTYQQRMRWFHQARFGMFIHWGLYSIPGRGEWTMLTDRTPQDEYARLAEQFKPSKFDPQAWAALAAQAGMKYMVFTSRHHDGYCLYDSKVSDFTSVKCAAGRDFVAEYVRACRQAGLRVGLYYSLLDWRFKGYWEHRRYKLSAAAMVKQVHDQVRELLTNYGRIDYLFFDGEWIPGIEHSRHLKGIIASSAAAHFWQSTKLLAMVRRLQPHIIVNNRTALKGDVDTPEQQVTASAAGRGWESCMTLGDSAGWGYIRNNPNMKTAPQLLQHLITAAAGEGNFLLNIGPKADGAVRTEEVRRLQEIGRWMKTNGQSIYGSQRCDLSAGMIGTWTRKGKTGYLHLFRYPGQEAVVPMVATKAISAQLLSTGAPLRIHRVSNGRLILAGLPSRPPHPHVNTVKVRFAEEPKPLPERNKALWLEGIS